MTTGLWLFAAVRPWVVALPVEAVERVLGLDDLGPEMAVVPLARLLGLPVEPGLAAVQVRDLGLLGVDRCLQVGPLPPGSLAVPPAALRPTGLDLRAFPLPATLDRPDSAGRRPAPFGLVLDPHRLSLRP